MGRCCREKLAKELDLYATPSKCGESTAAVKKSACPVIESAIHDTRVTITPYTIDLFNKGVAHTSVAIDMVKDLPKPIGLVAAGLLGFLPRTRTKRILTSVTAMGAMSALLYPEEFKEAFDLGVYMSRKSLKDFGVIEK